MNQATKANILSTAKFVKQFFQDMEEGNWGLDFDTGFEPNAKCDRCFRPCHIAVKGIETACPRCYANDEAEYLITQIEYLKEFLSKDIG